MMTHAQPVVIYQQLSAFDIFQNTDMAATPPITVQAILNHIQGRPSDATGVQQTWSGCMNPDQLRDEYVQQRHRFADAAYIGDWNTIFDIIGTSPTWEASDWVNLTRLRKAGESKKSMSSYTVLHQAAYHGAPVQIVEALIQLGAYRTLRSTDGLSQRPVDIARARGHTHLLDMLEPVILHPEISADDLTKIQAHFHKVISDLGRDLISRCEMRLPELSALQEMEDPAIWFPIPGMYGGFSFRLEGDHLIAKSFCRIVGGSGETRKITPGGVEIIDSGWG